MAFMLLLGAGIRGDRLGGVGCGDLSLLLLHFELLLHLAAVADELAGDRKFSEAVPYHIFRYKHFGEILAVMDEEFETDHLRRYRAGTRPCLNRRRRFRTLPRDLFENAWVDVWAFLKRSRH